MNLTNLTDQQLLKSTEQLVHHECELLTDVLRHLREIERRRLFSDLGFKSLFDYAVKKLGYADDQAARRISAMRLLKELPEIEHKITDGSLTLTNLSLAQTLFRSEINHAELIGDESVKTFDREKKLELLNQIENKSKREAEKIIASKASLPITLKPDRIRIVSEAMIEFNFLANADLQRKLEEVQGLVAHSRSHMSLGETIDLLCDMAIQKLDPAKRSAPDIKRRSESARQVEPAKALADVTTSGRVHIPLANRREVWHRAGSRCENCNSKHALQVDHIHPVAMGGTNDQSNLRLLCRTCNQRAAIRILGLNKIQYHVEL